MNNEKFEEAANVFIRCVTEFVLQRLIDYNFTINVIKKNIERPIDSFVIIEFINKQNLLIFSSLLVDLSSLQIATVKIGKNPHLVSNYSFYGEPGKARAVSFKDFLLVTDRNGSKKLSKIKKISRDKSLNFESKLQEILFILFELLNNEKDVFFDLSDQQIDQIQQYSKDNIF